MKGKGGLERSSLESGNIYIVKAAGQVYVWVGKDVESGQKSKAMEIGVAYLESQSLPEDTQIQLIHDRFEHPMFKTNFKTWEIQETKQKIIEVREDPKKEVNIEDMVSGLTSQVSKQMTLDDGSGQVKVWRVENFELSEVPEENYGEFYAGDSYVIQYSYINKNRQQKYIVYYWQGKDSTQDEKGASALLATKIDEDLGGAAVQVFNYLNLVILN